MTMTLSIDPDYDDQNHYLDPQHVLEDINRRYLATARDDVDPDHTGEHQDEEHQLP